MKSIFTFFLLLCAISGVSQAGEIPPDWYLEELDRQEGVWIADNTTYISATETFDLYEIEWSKGIGGVNSSGYLYGICDGTRSKPLWEFKKFWDIEAGKAKILQFGGDGTIGEGYINQITQDSMELVQRFQTPSGTTYLSGHRQRNGPNKEISRSYTITENGIWKALRSYTWYRKNSSGQLAYHTLESSALRDNKINEPPLRDVIVYTPPGYIPGTNISLPVVYLLHGYGETAKAWLESPHTQGFHLQKSMDSLIRAGRIKDMIVVLPDCSTKYGGSWYTNSSTSGNWEDFFIAELMPFIKEQYNISSVGIAGHSMGGYGALKLALRYPAMFDAVYGMSSVNLYADSIAQMKFKDLLNKMRNHIQMSEYSLFDRLVLSKAVAFVPNNTSPYYFDLLYDDTGDEAKIRPQVWERWSSHLLVNLIGPFKEQGQNLVIALDHGKEDFLVSESRNFIEKLHESGIDHIYDEFDGGHADKIRSRLENCVFAFFSENLD